MLQSAKEPSRFEKFMDRLPLYVRLMWASIILFTLVGNCAGHSEQAITFAAITVFWWGGMRILSEGLDAYKILRDEKKLEKEQKKVQ